jgi:hypothetical protein
VIPQRIPGHDSDSLRERTALRVLGGHLAWWLVFMAGSTVSAVSFCSGNDDCHGLWIFLWGMLWILGELVLAIPVLGACAYLFVSSLRGARRGPAIGLALLVLMPATWLVAALLLNGVATS